jgi:hypothetical protein
MADVRMVDPTCPKCGAREWVKPPDARTMFSAWDVTCAACGYRTTHMLGSLVPAEEEDAGAAD